MKKCLNCKSDVRDKDIYCRNCGILIKKNSYYVLVNVMIIIISIVILMLIILFIASYLMD